MFDLVIRDATIYDGTGSAPTHGDLGVANGKITAIGDKLGAARETVRADGLALAPGIIWKVSCAATDKAGKKYELQFDSDNQPVKVQRISQAPLVAEKRRAHLRGLQECRRRATIANVLPRDSASYVIQCLEEGSHKPPEGQQ